MTISSVFYSATQGAAMEYEMHFKATRGDDIQYEREHLATRGVEYYQQHVYYLARKWIPKSKIKVRFEREEPTAEIEETIGIEARKMEYTGSQWKAQALPSRVIGYAKRRRRRRTRR